MIKPIFIVGLPARIKNSIKEITEDLNKNLEGYYVLTFTVQADEPYFSCFYEKDFNQVKFEELKQIIYTAVRERQSVRLRFYKESNNRWYIDLPEWKGSKDELEMVAGADNMLEYMAEGENQVWLLVSEESFENADKLKCIRLGKETENGAYYKLDSYKGIEVKLEMWLCDVVKFIFHSFPKVLYISKID